MKKTAVVSFLLAFVLLFALCGCDNEGNLSALPNSQASASVQGGEGQQSSNQSASSQNGESSSVNGGNTSSVAGGGQSSSTGGNQQSSVAGGGQSSQLTPTEPPVYDDDNPTDYVAIGGGLLPTDMTKGGTYPTAKAGDIYLAPNGNDANSGTQTSPLYSLSTAITKATAGTTIFMKAGQYNYSSTIQLAKSGTKDQPITIQAENWDEVIIDFKGIPYGNNKNGWGFKLTGNYWVIQGLTIQYAGDNAIKVEGSYNYIGRCITHHNGDTGIQLGFGHHTNKDNDGSLCAYNTIENCDSYVNMDFDNGEDADGFACKMHNGKNNVFIGCRAWSNCDDAWDLYETNYSVYIVNCWAWGSAIVADMQDFDQAYLAKTYTISSSKIAKKGNTYSIKDAGNGNGIKLGGNGEGGASKGVHYVYNCVSFNNNLTNSVKGFDENSHKDGLVIKNCVAFDNGYNYMLDNGGSPKNALSNCISLKTGNFPKVNKSTGEMKAGTCTNCNFTLDGTDLTAGTDITVSDFVTLSVEAAKAPRQADGSLPNNGFARLKTTSSSYGKGMGLV